MFIIWVIITVEVFLSPRGNIDYDDRHDEKGHNSLGTCNRKGVRSTGRLLAWGLLAYFTVFREGIDAAVGDVYSENEWEVGQILALVTWMPVVLEFFYIFICKFKRVPSFVLR